MESFVRFARRIGATVCAEGIESLDDLAVARRPRRPVGAGVRARAARRRRGRPSRRSPPEVCRAALAEALRASSAGNGQRIAAGDRRLEHLSARLASARSRTDLEGALALIARGAPRRRRSASPTGMPEAAGRRDARRERRDRRGALPARRLPADRPRAARPGGRSGPGRRPGGRPARGRAAAQPRPPLAADRAGRQPRRERSASSRPTARPSARGRATEINRARIISNQFGSVIQALFRSRAALVD